MQSRPLDAQELYVRIGHHLSIMPVDLERYTPENEIWISKAVALIKAAGDPRDTAEVKAAATNYRGTPSYYGKTFWGIMQRALASAELAAPASSAGAFLPVGSQMDAMSAISKIFKEAQAKVLVVDPYMDEVILTDFAAMIPEGVQLNLLSDSASVKGTVAPAVRRWTSQYAAKRPIEARTTPPRALHDRLIIVDDNKVWSVSQSFKDLAARSPASIALVPTDVAMLKVPAYADIWTTATPL